jgi:hypothetical protein
MIRIILVGAQHSTYGCSKQNFFRNIWLKYHATSYPRLIGRGWVGVGSGLVRRCAVGAGVRRGRGGVVWAW